MWQTPQSPHAYPEPFGMCFYPYNVYNFPAPSDRLCQWLNGNLSARPSEQLPMGRKTEPSVPPALEYGWVVMAFGKLHCSSPGDQGSAFRRSWLRVFYLKPNQQKVPCHFFMSRNTSDKTNLKSYTNQQNSCRCSTFFFCESQSRLKSATRAPPACYRQVLLTGRLVPNLTTSKRFHGHSCLPSQSTCKDHVAWCDHA